MRDVRFGWDLLLSLLFNGPGPDCILRRRVKELGTETPYARSSCWPALRTLTSFVCADLIGVWLRYVITGNRPHRVRVFNPEADPASVPPFSADSSRIPVGVDRRPTDCLIRPDLKRHAFHSPR